MSFVVAGTFGIGGPEVPLIFLVLLLVVFLTGRAVGTSKQFSRFCPTCGRGLNFPKGTEEFLALEGLPKDHYLGYEAIHQFYAHVVESDGLRQRRVKGRRPPSVQNAGGSSHDHDGDATCRRAPVPN